MHSFDETEWQKQETARLGNGSDVCYVLIAQTLAQPLPSMLPSDFAERVSNLALARIAAPGALIEWILSLIALVLTLAAVWVALLLNPTLPVRLMALFSETPVNRSEAGWLLWLLVALVAASVCPKALKLQTSVAQRHS
jgi:hypothetical protein